MNTSTPGIGDGDIHRISMKLGFSEVGDVAELDQGSGGLRMANNPVGIVTSAVENGHHTGVVRRDPNDVEYVKRLHRTLPEKTSKTSRRGGVGLNEHLDTGNRRRPWTR